MREYTFLVKVVVKNGKGVDGEWIKSVIEKAGERLECVVISIEEVEERLKDT